MQKLLWFLAPVSPVVKSVKQSLPEMSFSGSMAATGFQVFFKGRNLKSFFGKRPTRRGFQVFLKFHCLFTVGKSNCCFNPPRNKLRGVLASTSIMIS